MYQPDNAKKIIATEEATHTLAVQYPGTFVFSAGFKHSGLVIEGEHNFFGVSWIEESETMVISFATADEMKRLIQVLMVMLLIKHWHLVVFIV